MSVGRVHIKVTMQKPRKPCVGCSKRTTVVHPILGVHCCDLCQAYKSQFVTISERDIARRYKLPKVELITLRHVVSDVDRLIALHGLTADDGFEPANVYLERHVKELVASSQA
jgi:hypothetical protein